MNASTKILKAAAGTAAAGGSVTVDQVFSTDLYTGNGGTKQITNGLDMSAEGGLTWIKFRNPSSDGITGEHHLFDTVRGATKRLRTNSTAAEQAQSTSLTSFNSDGFTLGSFDQVNSGYNSRQTYCAWNFRKAPKFFDIQTWSGNSTNRQISHSLNSNVGMIIAKCTSTSSTNWQIFHKDSNASSPQNYRLEFNTGAAQANSQIWNNTAPTSTHFTVGIGADINKTGRTYIAYIFADNSSDSSIDAADKMITCGTYTGTGSTDVNVDCGFEPQWIMVKRVDSNSDFNQYQGWIIQDTMRGLNVGPQSSSNGYTALLTANTSASEGRRGNGLDSAGAGHQFLLTSTGFTASGNGDVEINRNNSGSKYIFMAVRRDNMAEVTDATKVFGISSNFISSYSNVGFPVDMVLGRKHQESNNWRNFARLIGDNFLVPNATNAQQQLSNEIKWDNNSGFYQQTNGTPNIWHQWRRAKGYFDVTTHTGTGSATTFPHSLGVPSEMIWCKRRDGLGQWAVYHAGNTASPATQYLNLNLTNATNTSSASWNNTAPTSTVFSVGAAGGGTNDNNEKFICYHFATLANVSKVGSYTGNDTGQNIDCGFTNSARFVLIKCSSDGDRSWMIFDSTRGIVAGADPFLTLEATSAENYGSNGAGSVQNYSGSNLDLIDPYSSGFAVVGGTGMVNENGKTYIFYAIA